MGVLKAIVQARSMAVETNFVDLKFLMFRWSIDTHTFMATHTFMVASGESSPSLDDPEAAHPYLHVAMLMSLHFFAKAHAIGATLKDNEQKKVDYLTKSLSKALSTR